MKTHYLILLCTLISVAVFGQDTPEKKYYDSLNNAKVKTCKISDEVFSIGDSVTIGKPLDGKTIYTYLSRKIEYYDIEGKSPVESTQLPDSWAGYPVAISVFYIAKGAPAATCVAEFIIIDEHRGWIRLDDAIRTKELAGHNRKTY